MQQQHEATAGSNSRQQQQAATAGSNSRQQQQAVLLARVPVQTALAAAASKPFFGSFYVTCVKKGLHKAFIVFIKTECLYQ